MRIFCKFERAVRLTSWSLNKVALFKIWIIGISPEHRRFLCPLHASGTLTKTLLFEGWEVQKWNNVTSWSDFIIASENLSIFNEFPTILCILLQCFRGLLDVLRLKGLMSTLESSGCVTIAWLKEYLNATSSPTRPDWHENNCTLVSLSCNCRHSNKFLTQMEETVFCCQYELNYQNY